MKSYVKLKTEINRCNNVRDNLKRWKKKSIIDERTKLSKND